MSMNYQKIYENIIKKSKKENRIKHVGIYYENHHIIPTCLNGNDKKENKVLLTAKEHFICHKLLLFIYPNNEKIIWAFHRMCYNKKCNNYIVSARDYAYARELLSNVLTGKAPWNKNKHLSEEHRKNISKSSKGKSKSEETKQKMKNHIFSEEHKQKLKGLKSEEHKRKLSEAKLGDLNPAKRSEVRQKISNTIKEKYKLKNDRYSQL